MFEAGTAKYKNIVVVMEYVLSNIQLYFVQKSVENVDTCSRKFVERKQTEV